MSKKNRLNRVEAIPKVEVTDEDKFIEKFNLHKNILDQALDIEVSARELALIIDKAQSTRQKDLIIYEQDMFSKTQCLSDDEAFYLLEYRKKIDTGEFYKPQNLEEIQELILQKIKEGEELIKDRKQKNNI